MGFHLLACHYLQKADKMSKLTETFVRKISHAKTGTDKYWDGEVKGLVLFTGKQSKTWYFQKDVEGQTKRILIGRYPVVSAAVARQTAMELSLGMSRGVGRLVQEGAPRLAKALDIYLARPKLRSEAHKAGMRQLFDRHLRDWLQLPLTEITKSKVVDRHMALAASPSTANHALKYFRTVWNHARRTHDLPESPTMAIEWYEEAPDGRIIADLVDWRNAVDALDNPIHRAFFKFLLMTGLRKTEAFTLTLKDVHEGRIHLPMTKNGRSFDLPIHHDILRPLKGLSDTWVFPSPKSKAGHIIGPGRLKWSPHAHRRTFATVAVEAGVLEEIVGRLLNHTPLSITGQRYALPSLEALRPSIEIICQALSERSGGGYS